MMKLNKFLLLSAIAVLMSLTQSCSQANNEKPNAAPQDLYAQIQQTANIEGCSTSADCGLLPIGNKPCGGPEAYMAYSKTNSDVAALEKMAQQYTEQRRQYNKDNQIIGTCQITPKPSVSCIRNQCMASKQNLHIQ